MAASTPPAARYPLFADERPAPTVPRQGPAAPDAPTVVAPAPGQERGRVRAWTLPVVAVLLLMLLAGGGAFLFLRGTADDAATDAAGRTDASPASGVGDTEEPNTSTAPTDITDTGEAGENRPTEDVTDLIAAVDVPGQAPASTDARSGAKVTFGPGNLTDDDATTAWRVAGDASGSRLTISFTGPVELREVGLINGYAKVYDGYNGYQGNRRVLAVRWILDDGTEVRQDLDSSQEVQMMPIDAVTTEQVTLEILDTSAPGDGRSGRDFTAISELAFGGVAG